ncbi:hypothetical protein [Massilia antarctica]|uniref:hypothetical protein n=2 Tax=Massilia TaxID=149698 RepID=UPI00227225D1|nr:hypothetical protein [Massilia sp. H27-R4]MCY0916246.1 hypothetical protein [Massilia sp. H27-R4]
MTQIFTNNAESVLAVGITAAATSITVKAGEGALFPNPLDGDYFLITLLQRVGGIEMNWEIVKCTARADDVLTIERYIEGSTPRPFNAGDPVSLRLTAGAILPVYRGALTGPVNEAPTVPMVSSPSMAIAATGANTLAVSGTAVITAFDAIAPGAIRRMTFTGAATFTYHPVSMRLIGGADIVTAPGDWAEWISLGGGSWQMMSYTRANGESVKPISAATQATLDLKASLSGVETMSGKTLINPTVKNFIESTYAPAPGASFAVDLTNGTVQKFTTTANTTITLPASVAGKSFTVIVAFGGAHTVTFSGGTALRWAMGGGVPNPTAQAGKVDIYVFLQDGTFTYAQDGGRNF